MVLTTGLSITLFVSYLALESSTRARFSGSAPSDILESSSGRRKKKSEWSKLGAWMKAMMGQCVYAAQN